MSLSSHPYYGAEGHEEETDSFDELRDAVDSMDEDYNHLYRWDWKDASDEQDGSEYRLYVFFVMQRKSQCFSLWCPVTDEDEPAVQAWLEGPRVLGALRTMWAPLLDEVTT